MATMVTRCAIMLCFFCVDIGYGQQFNDDDLNFVHLVHRSFCGAYSLCSPPKVIPGDNTTGVRSLDDLPVVPEPLDLIPRPSTCCKSCSCDITTCVEYGNCCPDILDRIPRLDEIQEHKSVLCETLSVRHVEHSLSVWLYGLCSRDYVVDDNQTAADIRSRCEDLESYFDLDSRLPVIDPATQRVYANKFCAICDFINESRLIPTTPRLACFNGERLPNNVQLETLIQEVLGTQYCDLEFSWPEDRVKFDPPVCRHVETQCNVTGLWKVYDPLIEAACRAYRADYDYRYNNIFCYLCNEVSSEEKCEDSGSMGVGTLSFAAVLDFTSTKKRVNEAPQQCSEMQVYDHYKDKCRDLTCTFPRVLQGGECINIGNRVTEVAYKLQLKFQPIGLHDGTGMEDMVIMITDYATDQLTVWESLDAAYKFSLFYKLGFTPLHPEDLERTDANRSITTLSSIITTTTTVAATTCTTTTCNTTIPPTDVMTLVLAVEYILWEVEWYFNPRISGYHEKDFLDKVLQLEETNLTLSDQTFGKSFSFSLWITDFEADEVGHPLDPDENTSLAPFPVDVLLPNASPLLNPFQQEGIQEFVLKQTLVCPLVEVDTSEYNITENSFGIFVKELNSTFARTRYHKELIGNSRRVYLICKDAYISITDSYIQNKNTLMIPESEINAKGVLSVVCACISIMCSFITLVTYLLFRELRTQPGINNMLLCVSLICAQTFFTFATIQEETVSGGLCSFLGALAHFFWLMVVFAMNVCCYHMFKVFKRQSTIPSHSETRLATSIRYTVYCVCSPLVFVVINIIVVFFDTDEEESGYGSGGLCYISRPKMVGYVFAIPIGIVLLVNLVFFITVIVKIARSPTVSSSNKKERNYLKIYAKLSSITGLTWIFGFLYLFTHQVVFEYIFIILSDSIGVFIFLSFVFNRRNYKRYKEKITGKPLKRKDCVKKCITERY